MVREFDVGTQPEGCVADDVLGHLYVGEEDVAIWKYGAEPGAGSARTQLDHTGQGGNLVADVEGLAIYHAGPDRGYLLSSSQGNSTVVIYTREGANTLVGKFAVVENGTVDAVTGTDGLDVTNFALGPAFPAGARRRARRRQHGRAGVEPEVRSLGADCRRARPGGGHELRRALQISDKCRMPNVQ